MNFQEYLQAGSPVTYALAFLGGLATGFNPRTYPILPVKVGYLGSRAGGSPGRTVLLSAAYVSGMAMTYAALGMAAALTGRLFGEVTAHPLSYLAAGNVCIVLSLALFDVIRLPTPAFLSRISGAGSRTGGAGGAFLVRAVSGVIVVPCTAPVLGGGALMSDRAGIRPSGPPCSSRSPLEWGCPSSRWARSQGCSDASPGRGCG
jgi:cytochrome c-type biogenesis protein